VQFCQLSSGVLVNAKSYTNIQIAGDGNYSYIYIPSAFTKQLEAFQNVKAASLLNGSCGTKYNLCFKIKQHFSIEL